MLLNLLTVLRAEAQAPAPPPPPPDVSVSSLGVQTWTDSAIRGVAPTTDMDLLVGERLRWTLAGDVNAPGTDVLALVDARFTVDPSSQGAPPLEWSAVRQAGAQILTQRWTIDLGRAMVYRGGPRLVDGVQALYAPSDTVRVGVWAGLAPDLFTTLPRLRPGGGPIVSYATSKIQLSLVGEVLGYDGALDRAGALAMGRVSFERTLDLSARLDIEAAGPAGTRLDDGLLSAVVSPSTSFRIDAFYNAYSSYRYLTSDKLDPDLQRFAERLQQLGIDLDLTQDVRDPSLNHLVGGGVRFQPENGDGMAPRLGLVGRYRANPDPANTYTRINPQAGLVQVGGMLDVIADGNVILVDEGTQIDGGVLVYLQPAGPLAFDASARLIKAADALGGLGWYGDLFVDIVSPELDLLMIAGGSATSETDPLDGQKDLGFGVFVRMAKYLRPKR